MKFSISILLAAVITVASALQFCQNDPDHDTDLCLAVSSATNASTGQDDLSIHFSVEFKDENGWAAVGLGEGMKGALMFVMYPGVEAGDTTLNVRTIDRWAAPQEITSHLMNGPSISISKLWYEPSTKLHNAQITCYSCSSWSTSPVSGTNFTQPFIWSSNMYQSTRSASTSMALQMHRVKGTLFVNMAPAFTAAGSELIPAHVNEARVSTPGDVFDVLSDAGISGGSDGKENDGAATSPPKHHHHNAFGVVAIHGMLLAASFVALSLGTLVIRSGLAKSFKLHWVVQVVGGVGIVVGCLMGIYISYSHGGHFRTYHQWIGLTILPIIPLQALFGYLHHVNFVRYRSRTAISNYHVYLGRVLLIFGNINVYLGLNLANVEGIKRVIYCLVIIMQANVLGLMWFFWVFQGRTVMDVVRGSKVKGMGEMGAEVGGDVRYGRVDGGEGDAFIVGEIGDEYELDEEEGHGSRKGEEEGDEQEKKSSMGR